MKSICNKIMLNVMIILTLYNLLRTVITLKNIANDNVGDEYVDGTTLPLKEEKKIIAVNNNINNNINNNNDNNNNNIAYVIAITSNSMEMIDGATVLAYSIRKNHHHHHHHNTNDNNVNNYELLALIDSSATSSVEKLEQIGYKTIVLEEPVIDINKIKNKNFINDITRSGCCGEKELIKLHTFRLYNYTKVVYFDTDAILLKPLKEEWLFGSASDDHQFSLIFGYDYSNVGPNHYEKACVQGGFFIVKPSQIVFNKLQSIIIQGQYTKHNGWGQNTKCGSCFGGETIQGLFSYYVQHIAANTEVLEVDRCIINSFDGSKNSTGYNCQYVDVNTIISFHFTNQKKPWKCNTLPIPPHGWNLRKIINIWWSYRNEFEFGRNLTVVPKSIGCKNKKYIPIQANLN